LGVEKKLAEYCSNIEDEFNSAGDEIIRKYDTQMVNSKDPLFGETMRISRSLDMEIPEERRN
jgi:hypothetical protein